MKMLIVAAVAIAALTPAGLASARTDSPVARPRRPCRSGQGVLVPPLMSPGEIARPTTSSLREEHRDRNTAAIANDVYRVTGRRIRSLPIAVGQLLLLR